MDALTNRQQRDGDDNLVDLLRLIDQHPERHDLIRSVDICGTPDEKQFLILSKDGLEIHRFQPVPTPKDYARWTETRRNEFNLSQYTKERVRDYRACVTLFRGSLYVHQLQGLLAQLGS